MNKEKFTLIGAGLAGPLLATYLAKRGYSVEMFERRQDMRKESIQQDGLLTWRYQFAVTMRSKKLVYTIKSNTMQFP